MARVLSGTVVSTSMTNTIVVEVTRHIPHPLYRKLMKRSKKHKVHVTDEKVSVGQLVRIVETKPISKGKHFKLFVAGETKVKEAMTPEPKVEKVKTVKKGKKSV